uniref:Putative secreted protein n=1 Tax=Anopheles triannulatus TaxID=58253 RepID=A0A2M4B7A3_9DIPT
MPASPTATIVLSVSESGAAAGDARASDRLVGSVKRPESCELLALLSYTSSRYLGIGVPPGKQMAPPLLPLLDVGGVGMWWPPSCFRSPRNCRVPAPARPRTALLALGS